MLFFSCNQGSQPGPVVGRLPREKRDNGVDALLRHPQLPHQLLKSGGL